MSDYAAELALIIIQARHAQRQLAPMVQTFAAPIIDPILSRLVDLQKRMENNNGNQT